MKSKLPDGFQMPAGAQQVNDRRMGLLPGHVVVSANVNGDMLLQVAIAEESIEGAMREAAQLAGEFGQTLEPPVSAVEVSGLTLIEAYERGVDHEDEAEKAQIAMSALTLIDHAGKWQEILARGARHLALEVKASNGKGFHLTVSAGWPLEDGEAH